MLRGSFWGRGWAYRRKMGGRGGGQTFRPQLEIWPGQKGLWGSRDVFQKLKVFFFTTFFFILLGFFREQSSFTNSNFSFTFTKSLPFHPLPLHPSPLTKSTGARWRGLGKNWGGGIFKFFPFFWKTCNKQSAQSEWKHEKYLSVFQKYFLYSWSHKKCNSIHTYGFYRIYDGWQIL